ncbi:hypothetical protein [Salinivirga cyanobacteriivorans]
MKQLLIILAIISALGAQAQKQHFQRVEHQFILQKIANTNPGTWSLSENTSTRHYGLTDKEFFKNFGNDRVGKIGSETRVENYDKIGLNYVAIHALVIENKQLKSEIANMKQTIEELQKSLNKLQETFRNQNKKSKK